MQIHHYTDEREEEIKFIANADFTPRLDIIRFFHAYYLRDTWFVGDSCNWYFDTTDLQLYRAGYDLRLRQKLHRFEISLCLKDRGHIDKGYFNRRELSEFIDTTNLTAPELQKSKSFQLALDCIRKHSPDCTGAAQQVVLRPVLKTYSVRTGISVWPTKERSQHLSKAHFWLSCDRVTIEQVFLDQLSFPQENKYFEVEVEAIVNDSHRLVNKQTLLALRDVLLSQGYTPCDASKYERALTLCGISRTNIS